MQKNGFHFAILTCIHSVFRPFIHTHNAVFTYRLYFAFFTHYCIFAIFTGIVYFDILICTMYFSISTHTKCFDTCNVF